MMSRVGWRRLWLISWRFSALPPGLQPESTHDNDRVEVPDRLPHGLPDWNRYRNRQARRRYGGTRRAGGGGWAAPTVHPRVVAQGESARPLPIHCAGSRCTHLRRSLVQARPPPLPPLSPLRFSPYPGFAGLRERPARQRLVERREGPAGISARYRPERQQDRAGHPYRGAGATLLPRGRIRGP